MLIFSVLLYFLLFFFSLVLLLGHTCLQIGVTSGSAFSSWKAQGSKRNARDQTWVCPRLCMSKAKSPTIVLSLWSQLFCLFVCEQCLTLDGIVPGSLGLLTGSFLLCKLGNTFTSLQKYFWLFTFKASMASLSMSKMTAKLVAKTDINLNMKYTSHCSELALENLH